MLYLFDKNENLIHELASNEIESLIQHEELNKLMTLEFGVFIDSNDKMKDIEYVAHKDMEDYEKIQMYRVISSESDDYTVNYQAVHIIFDELKSYGYIRDKRPDKVKASVALNIALAGSRWKVGRVDDSQLLSTNFYDCTRIDALSKIIKTWNLDLHFYLTFDGNKITGRYIDLLSFRGEDTGERFVYGSNALEVVKEVDKSEVYTRVIPRGKGEEKLDEEGKPTDGYGRRIKIDDVIWEKSKGNPIDKPKGQEYLELKEMTNKFGFSDGEPRTRVQIFEDIEDPKELIKAGYNFLVQVSRPLVQFKTKISKSSRTNVGDIVRIIRWDLDLKYRTRIYKAHRNLLNRTLEVEFGDKLVTSPADRDKIVNDNLNALENRLKETETDLKSSFIDKVTDGITQATFNRDGYNYELKKGNKYGLPAGYYSFDREIDNNPQRVIYVGAGTLAIADSKKSNGDWNFRTFGTGKGFVADLLVAGTILGGNVRWNLEDGTFLIGKNANDYSMYWDGGTLHFRNVDIDLKNSKDFSEIKDDLDKKISKEDILEDKEIQDALKGKDGANGIPGKDGKDGMPGKAGADGKTSYMHFAYADSADGVVGFTLTATNGKKYIGFYTDFVKEDSKDPKKYTWQLVKGNKGEKGEPGKDGKNINRNYIDDSKFKTVTVPKKLYDEAYNIDPSFWDTYNRQAMTLSFWFKARESKTYKRNFVVHFRAAPWYQFGTVVYPENTTENIFYKMHIGSKMMPQDYRAAQIFIRFIEEYSGNVFEIKDLKLEFGNEATDWIPSVNDLKGEPGKNGVDGKTGKIGQNLLRNSNVPIENKNYPTNIWNLCETPTTGETMTFTVKIKLEKDDKICLYNSGGYIWMGDWTKINKIDDYQIWSKTFEWKDKIQYNGVVYVQTNPPTLRLYTYSNGNGEDKNNTVSIEWATLTRGDIPAIEWTPCYADVDDAIKAGKEESEEISRKLIKVESDFKIENNNIKASVSSLSKTTERSFVNLKKDMADADVKVETGIKNYLINNYSTKTQTDQKISQEVGSIKTSLGNDINNLNKEVTEAKSMVEQTQRGVTTIVGQVEYGLNNKINDLNARIDIQADKIEAKVSKDGFSSLVKQEFDRYKVQAKNIDFDGSYVNVKGTFQTLNTNEDVGVEMSYNQVVWKDNRWEGKTFGKITVTKIVGSEYGFSLNFGHYPTGFLSMSYWNNDDKKWYSYMQLDKWNYTGNGGITPIIFHENLNCLRHSIRIGNWELVPEGDTLKIKPYDTKAGYIFQRGGLYRYYASGGKDVKTKID